LSYSGDLSPLTVKDDSGGQIFYGLLQEVYLTTC